MPVIGNGGFVQPVSLGRTWTYESAASRVAILTQVNDNENVQWLNIRNHINVAISTVVERLELSQQPWYRISLPAQLEPQLHMTGLYYIDLSKLIQPQPSNEQFYVPIKFLSDIIRLTIPVITEAGVLQSNFFSGNCTKKDITELNQLQSSYNTQWMSSVAWAHNGNEILIFIGDQIATGLRPTPNPNVIPSYTLNEPEDKGSFIITAERQPMLDDLKPPDGLAPSLTYRTLIDIPDKYINLVIQIAQKSTLEQLEKTVPQALENQIAQQFGAYSQQVSQDLTIAQARREKQDYGNPPTVR